MSNKRYRENLERGKESEYKFLQNLKNAGRIAKIYYSELNGKGGQLIETFRGILLVCPDIEVLEESGSVILRIEVKSYTKLYKDGNDLFVTIPEDQFHDYLKLLEYEEIDIKVVFHVKESDDWYWKDLIDLDLSKESPKKLYFPRDQRSHYKWKYNSLNTDFSWISNE
jgi:hypothetical protein